ncbi:MAG TPA: sulfite exporter TauE/SafE family protein [Spirochaetota bacterium]|nr:sulfite exporter TauE/SafE family protein [Spirochaetota bacterium]
MIIPLLAGIITFLFTTVLTIAGVGAAFILIPVFIGLKIDIHVAMATALLLNSIAMTFASYRFYKDKLIMWQVALPILVIATALSPLGAWTSRFLDRTVLLWLFTAFLVFAGSMMLFYQPKASQKEHSHMTQIISGLLVGAFAGFLGGLLGVGGGNFIVPVLVWLGYDPKKSSATTSFIVIFSSLSGFMGHATLGAINVPLLAFTASGSATGALLGAWLMSKKLQQKQVKAIIGVVLFAIAIKMAWSLL